ncbi:MAG TPA: ABC transporter substrate-binding protein [Atribacterota bacterium]|nr:ABC transporter substrate-binding protein [Atribacterota bacterium]
MFKINKYRSPRIFVLVGFFLMILTICAYASDSIIFNYGIDTELSTLEPANFTNVTDFIVVFNLYDPLVYPTMESGKIVKPWIAKSWDISKDAKTYTFYLNKGIKFHDGSEVTAEDVAFSMDRMMTIGGRTSNNFASIIKSGNTEVIDKYTVVFHLEKPSASLLANLLNFFILNKNLLLQNKREGQYGEYGDYGKAYLETHDVGSGPYKLNVIKYAELITFDKFKDYWKKWEENSIDEVRIKIIPEEVTRATMLQDGILDMADWCMDPTRYDVLEKVPGIIVNRALNTSNWFLILNNQKPPFDDIYVRKAVAYAVDYDAISKNITRGKQAIGPLPINMTGHSNDVIVYYQDYKKAKEMLQKSKYSPEELAKFQLIYKSVVPSARLSNIALSVMDSLDKIGLNVKIENTTWTDLCYITSQPNPDVNMTSFYSTGLIPDPFTFLVYFTKSYWNSAYPPGMMFYENPEVTKLINEARKTIEIEKQLALYVKAQKLITEDCPVIFLSNDGYFMPFRDYVKGYEYPVGAGYYDLRFDNLRIEK